MPKVKLNPAPPPELVPPSRRTKKQQAMYDEGYTMGRLDGIQEGYFQADEKLKKERREFHTERTRFRSAVAGARHISRALHDLLDNVGCD